MKWETRQNKEAAGLGLTNPKLRSDLNSGV